MDLTEVTPAVLNNAVNKLMTVIENEDKMVAILAMSGLISTLANQFVQPQAVLDYAFAIAAQSLKDISILHNVKTEGKAN